MAKQKAAKKKIAARANKKMQYEAHLFDLYKLSVEEVEYFTSQYQKTVAFFIGLTSALFAATVAGMIKTEKPYHFVVSTIGPLSMIIVSWIGIVGTRRFYRQCLYSITTLKKIRYDLGLEDDRKKNPNDENDWIANECLIAECHKNSREGNSSEKWVDGEMKIRKWNYNALVTLLFYGVIVLAVLLFIDGGALGHMKYSKDTSACNQKIKDASTSDHRYDRYHR